MKRLECLKRTISLFLTILLLMSSLSVGIIAEEDPLAAFSDIKQDWSYDSIRWSVQNGLMRGTSGTTFSPSGTASRAQFVQVLLMLADSFGYNLNGYVSVDTFPDAKTNEWYSKAVAWASKNAILSGYGNGNFGTNDNLTRQDAASLIYRFLANYICDGSLPDKETDLQKFSDYKSIAAYAESAVSSVCAIGIMQGTGSGFAPQRSLTRAELAALLKRIYTYVTENNILTPYGMMKQGINVYTYAGTGTIECFTQQILIGVGEDAIEADTDEPVDTRAVMQDYYARGFDYIRLTFSAGYSIDQYDEDLRNYITSTDSGETTYSLQMNPETIENVKKTIRFAREAGLAVVLDMHDFFSYPAVLSNLDDFHTFMTDRISAYPAEDKDIDTDLFAKFFLALQDPADPYTVLRHFLTENDCDYSFNLFSEQFMKDFHEFVSEPTRDPEHFGALWGEVAEELKDLDLSVFFELINEREVNGAAARAAIDAIRKTGGNNESRMLVLYSYCWEYYNKRGQPLNDARETWDFGAYNDDRNLMFDIHHYMPADYTYGNAAYAWPAVGSSARKAKIDEMNARLVAAVDLRERTGRNVFIGEYGCYRSALGYMDYIRDFAASAAAKQIPVCVWASFHDKYQSIYSGDNFNIHSYRCGYWHQDFLKALFN